MAGVAVTSRLMQNPLGAAFARKVLRCKARDEGRTLVLFDEARNAAAGHFSCKPFGAVLAGRSALLRALRIVMLFVCGSRRASRPAQQRRGPMGFCISLLVTLP